MSTTIVISEWEIFYPYCLIKSGLRFVIFYCSQFYFKHTGVTVPLPAHANDLAQRDCLFFLFILW